MLSTLGHDEWEALAAADVYWRPRWDYLSVVAGWVRRIGEANHLAPQHVLEIGPYTRALVDSCDTMDCRRWPLKIVRGMTQPTWLMDARKTPWSMIDDDAYELAVAMQVWEHLAPAQEQAAAELMRIARCAVVSVPFEWGPGHGCHSGITPATVRRWFAGVGSVEATEVVGNHSLPRLVCRIERRMEA